MNVKKEWENSRITDFNNVEQQMTNSFHISKQTCIIDHDFGVIAAKALSPELAFDRADANQAWYDFVLKAYSLVDDFGEFEHRKSFTIHQDSQIDVYLFRFRQVKNPKVDSFWSFMFHNDEPFVFRFDYRVYTVTR